MRKLSILIVTCALLLTSCAPKITTSITSNYKPLDYRVEIRVFGVEEGEPVNSEILGTIKIGDTGFTTNCGWDVVIEKAKMEARKVGGNALKITKHTPPNIWGSSCHQITATILKVDDFDALVCKETVDSTLINADYALLHVYRYRGLGAMIGYDLHLGDSSICRVKNNWRQTIKIRKDGLNSLWAKTESKAEVPVNIKFGTEYYLRCSVTMGMFVGHPSLELVDKQTGHTEYQSIDYPDIYDKDIIVLYDGREFICDINSEDDTNVYFTINRNGREIKTQVNKKDIESIQRAN